jgi:hypothetical protein
MIFESSHSERSNGSALPRTPDWAPAQGTRCSFSLSAIAAAA